MKATKVCALAFFLNAIVYALAHAPNRYKPPTTGAENVNCWLDIKLCAAKAKDGTIYPRPNQNK